jgi:carboxylesterase type B
LRYVFDNAIKDPYERQASKIMVGYWVNFIKFGNPNGNNLPNWKKFDNISHTALWISNKQNEPFCVNKTPYNLKNILWIKKHLMEHGA